MLYSQLSNDILPITRLLLTLLAIYAQTIHTINDWRKAVECLQLSSMSGNVAVDWESNANATDNRQKTNGSSHFIHCSIDVTNSLTVIENKC